LLRFAAQDCRFALIPQLPYGRSVTPEVSNSDQLFLSKEAIVVVETSTSSPLFQVF
jgi:hypothetical protein